MIRKIHFHLKTGLWTSEQQLAHERFDIRTATAVHGGDVVLSPLHLKLSKVFEL